VYKATNDNTRFQKTPLQDYQYQAQPNAHEWLDIMEGDGEGILYPC